MAIVIPEQLRAAAGAFFAGAIVSLALDRILGEMGRGPLPGRENEFRELLDASDKAYDLMMLGLDRLTTDGDEVGLFGPDTAMQTAAREAVADLVLAVTVAHACLEPEAFGI